TLSSLRSLNEHGHLKIYLPKKLLECLPKCSSLPKERHRWNTNEEIAAYLITFEKHEEWLTTSPKTRPQNGSMILYNRKKVKYRKDGYCWKKRKDGKTTREDHMKLKVQGVECLYGCYVHSSIIPTFHRRCYWLLQNPDIVLVHYLNVPAIEDCGKPCGPILCSINTDKKEWAKWTKEELIGQLKPMFHGIKWTCSNGNSSTGFSAEQLVQQILDSHQTKPPPRTHNCLCTGNLGAGSSLHHKCNSAKHRIISPKVDPRTGGAYSSTHSEVQNNDVSEGKTEHSHGRGKNEKRNGKVHKPALLHQNSMEVSSSNQVEVPDTTQSSPVSISSGLNSDPDMADSPVVTGMGHVASVMSSLSQSAAVFMSEVSGDPVYSMSPTVDPNTHLLGPDTASSSLVLAVTADTHKFAFAGAVGVGLADAGSTDGLSMLSAASVSEELVLSSNLESGSIKLPETNMNFDPDCFLNNPKQGQTYGGNGLKTEESNRSSCSNGGLRCSPPLSDNGYGFNASLVKNIKTEDTSFEQHGAVGISGSTNGGSAQNSLALTATGSLLPSGGGLSPSTTLEQMDFSAIDAKQDYPSSVMEAAGYSQSISSSHLAHQSHSPSFFLQGSPQSQTQTHQNNSSSTQNSHDSNAYMGLSVIKTDSTGTNGEGGETEGVGGAEHYLQQPTEGGGVGNVGTHQSLGSSGTNGGGSMEISLDHFDVSFGNQFSDLINDFISVEGGSGTAVVAGSNALYSHQLMTHSGTEGQVSSGTAAQQGADEVAHGARGYNSADLCLQPCCSPQSTQAGAVAGEAGQLAYMQVAEAVSAAVVHGNMGMLQATGRLFVVTDYSPEWSYPEGGVKVLITGPWQEASSEYTCLFDQITVPASLIQPGVLRCYCPAHDTGLVTLQVAASSQIISNSVVFEYKARALPALPSSQHDWLSLDDNQFRMSILERLEQMERRMAEMAGQQQQQSSGGPSESGGTGTGGGEGGRSPAGNSFESRVVVVCEKMMNRACWAKSKHLIHSKTFRGMTLLHLAAAQGYTTLIQTLIKWRTKHADSIDLELEVDPLNVDHFSCTPLMWACALGHMEAAVVLYKWDQRALAIPDSLGRLPLAIARSRGHTKLAECLESFQREEQQSGALTTTPSMPFSQSTEASAAEGWMNVWGTETSSIPKDLLCTFAELRRPRSEPSSFYSSVSHGDAPLSKKHKPNPETLQTQPSKSCSAPLGLDEQAHKSKMCPSREGTVEKEQRDGEQSQTKLGSTCGVTGAILKEPNFLFQNTNMMTLAEEVIEATSDRIKRENFVASDTTLDGVGVSSTMSWLASYLGDAERFLFNKPLTSSPGLGPVHGGGQPELDGPLGKLGLQSPAEWPALLNASHNKEERELTQLALSDPEQRELYEAARQVQNTFRKYKGRPLREQQELAAAVIQRCYKRYKQLTWIALKYALYKKMTLAAILIQSKFRSYHEQKKFQQSRRAAVLIQQYYRSYKELGRPNPRRRATAAALVQHKLRSSLLTKRQDQAARKIMRFLLRCRHR
uniref:Calmodulin-binding transcription activator 1 n=1 Tax=Cyprinus carpio TaxID=7962 RepID=A0A8C2FV37_CYPCA